MDDPAPVDSERTRLLGHISATLTGMNDSELRNLWRMMDFQVLSPKNAHHNHNLGHYPCREVANTLEEILPVCFRDQWGALQREMPVLLHAATEDFSRILLMCSNTTLVPVETLQERLRSFTDREKPSDDTEEVSFAAWELYGEYCKLSALVTFIKTLATMDVEPTTSQDIIVFSTECQERASGILFDQATSVIHADHVDWIRMKASQSLRVQGSLVNGDMLVSEVMYDTACRLGMPSGIGIAAQVAWLQERAAMWVWVTKLIRQGCWAPLMFIVGTALFGAEFTWQLTAAMSSEDGHKLDIHVTEEEGGAYKLSIVASARFPIRDSTPDMNVIGKIPMRLIVTFMVDQKGTTTGFNMATSVRFSKKVINWHEVKERTLPIAFGVSPEFCEEDDTSDVLHVEAPISVQPKVAAKEVRDRAPSGHTAMAQYFDRFHGRPDTVGVDLADQADPMLAYVSGELPPQEEEFGGL